MKKIIIQHYGTKRHSGRYPWGSGGELHNAIKKLREEGLSESEIAKALGMSTTELRNQNSLSAGAEKEARRIDAQRRKDSGMSIAAISREMKIPESTVRDLLKPGANAKYRLIRNTADALKKMVEKYLYLDVGDGVEHFMGVSRVKLDNAITLLKNEGYTIHYLREEQLGTGKPTSYKVLAPPETEWKDVYANRANIKVPNHTSPDGGVSFDAPLPVNNVRSDRVHVVYDSEYDGLIELRPGVPDLQMNGKNYAQVRIGVDGSHFLKGVAVYNDKNMPAGADIVFHTNKLPTNDKRDVFKKQSPNKENPFESTVKQLEYNENGVKKVSALNLVYGSSDWADWSRSLSSQFLSKQDPSLAKQQLQLVTERYEAELDEIMRLTNPTVKSYMLQQFADQVDSAAVHLKAAALPRQTTSVLIPESTMKPNEVFAPNYKNGESVVLVRYPHGGIFEIPTLQVNNKNPNAKRIIGSDAPDAIAIHPDVAKRLSGADFDGDTVIVLPSNRIKTSPALEGLKNFEPRLAYPKVEGMRVMTSRGTQMQMGIISNLITDMTIMGASQSEIARAVRHSMVVIDAEKHGLNYQQSYKDNGIAALKKKYQGSTQGGASTIISLAKSPRYVLQRKDNYEIDPQTGKKIYTNTENNFVNPEGKVIFRKTRSTKMYEEADAHVLSSGTRIEGIYADHANNLKALGNRARLETLGVKPIRYSPKARETYSAEVKSLSDKLILAERHRPIERKAQLAAGELYRRKIAANPDMDRASKASARGKLIVLARNRLGPPKPTIDITPQEWTAIQMGAISPYRLSSILRNADSNQVKMYATPRSSQGLSPGAINRANNLLKLGYTRAEVASSLGISVSALDIPELKEGG